MLFSILFARPRAFVRLLSALLVLSVAASCTSSRSAYQFRSAPAANETLPLAPSEPVLTKVVTVRVGRSAPAARPRTIQPHRTRPFVLRKQPLPLLAPAAAVPARPRLQLGHSFRPSEAAAMPQRPAEVGLGTTVLGVLGLVVLPIALLGLLIWGGPVWAVLAGLSALAVLIAYLDPFG